MTLGIDDEIHNAIDLAKLSIAPGQTLDEWSLTACAAMHASPMVVSDRSVLIAGRNFEDNVKRLNGLDFQQRIDGVNCHGDNLPDVPAVLTGLLDDWPAFCKPGVSWSVEDLAMRTNKRVSLDGGPSFARMSMCCGKVSLREYQEYCDGNAASDAAPLYVFDPDILNSSFTDTDGGCVNDAFQTPSCFVSDAMGCINGSEYRPLPPAWLLVGVEKSGTPIHDHPLTVAWNALLVGCKLWCCLPSDCDEDLLLLNLDENSDADFDLSALNWFEKCGQLPDSARVIVQRPGEVVYLPAGWFHVVLNVETSTAISVSLTLRRDLPSAIALLKETDEAFALFWMERLRSMYSESIQDSDSNSDGFLTEAIMLNIEQIFCGHV